MKNNNLIILSAFLMIFSSSQHAFAWGRWGHMHINRAAILALPDSVGTFFYDHADFITEESVIPDSRKYVLNDKDEFPRHFIDLELYNYSSAASMPQTMKQALAQFSNDSIQKNGILPWYIQDVMEKLSNAFKEKDRTEILFLSADLGHYIADAHMPLHTSVNHNGQFTDQVGIHAFWESLLPEMFGNNYNLYTGPVHYIDNITNATWAIVAHSFILKDSLLSIEKRLHTSYPADKVYLKDALGNIKKTKFHQSVYSPDYATQYHALLKGMVEQQMKAAIATTASYWYTAWVNAGRPDLSSLDLKVTTTKNAKDYTAEKKLWKTGKITGFKPENEF
ncbi:MAG: zinc dependent phospholipase C family protein [Bacteroidota bacterium]